MAGVEGAPASAEGVLFRQLAAIEAWLRLCREDQAGRPGDRQSRDQHLERQRQQLAGQREAQALRDRCLAPAAAGSLPRAVLAGLGVQVVVSVEDGAQGCGAAIA